VDLFDLGARYYDRVFGFQDPERLLDALQPQNGNRLLDIGGGTGRVSGALNGHVQVVICDPARGMLSQARGKGLRTCAGIAEHLPFADRSFERILAVDSLHHFRDQGVAAMELLRVLRPGGRLVVEEPDIRKRAVQVVGLLERLLLMHSRFLSLPDLKRTFEASGAVILSTDEGTDYNVRLIVSRQ
jgi:ubiquinone/menaquinone biosynthesis C-methylase UbiE